MWVENYLTVNIVDSQLTNFKSTPGPTFAYLNTEKEFILPDIENIVGLEYKLEMESKFDWLSFSKNKLTFEPKSDQGISAGDKFEVYFSFNAK